MGNAAKKIDFDRELNLKASTPDSLLKAIDQAQARAEFDLNGILCNANEKYLKMSGYSLSEIRGKHFGLLCIDPDSARNESPAREDTEMLKKLELGECFSREMRRKSQSGKEFWVVSVYSPLFDKKGIFNGFIEISTDISESKKELQVRTAIMNITSVVSEANLRGDILSVNDKFCELSQYSREELIGKPHNTTRHPDMPKEVFKELWSTIGRGGIFRGVVKNRKKDGTPYYVDAVIAPIIGENGKPKKYIGVRYDITDQEIERHNMRGIFSAIDSSYAYIEFDLNGLVLSANKNFLDTMEYSFEEIKGRHHRLFVDSKFSNSNEYASFWQKLKEGKSQSDVFKRLTKSGKEVWIQAVYSPVRDEVGRVFKIIKIATDVTAQNLLNIENSAKLKAIDKTQATIEFNTDGIITSANENWLMTLGYELEEIKGKHDRIFCDAGYASSAEYRAIWEQVSRGEPVAGEFKVFGKNKQEIWIKASFNPILDLNGKPYKVVKYASDITMLKRMIISVQETASALSAASSELTATATQLSSTATHTNQESQTASAAAEQVTAGVQTVAINMEEMVASIKEISRSANESSLMAKETLGRAHETNLTITKLGTSSQEIGDVIKVISSIAQQTNLLALNATIEAARAGDAGRGFAVVANEVKELAKQTAKATSDITHKISAIQNDTNSAVQAIGGISDAVERLNSISGVIAAAVEEQTATTNEVSRVVAESKKGVESIATTIKHVSTAANESTKSSGQTLDAAKELTHLAESLTSLFKTV